MIGRLVTRLVDAQAAWARPLGDFNHRWLSALFRPIRPVKDFFNGTWLGHPVHAAVTDLPIGVITVSIVLDLLGEPFAADVALILGVLTMLASAVVGLADYTDTDGTARMRATVHSTLMTIALVLFIISILDRNLGSTGDRAVPVGIAIVAYLVMTVGAAVGGDLVFLIGTHVNRHAWRGAGAKWVAVDLGILPDIPEGGPTKVKAGINDLAVIRNGDTILALHAQCAHAGGPLAEGTLVKDQIQCPWHGSRFHLANGHVARGPAMYSQPAYELRRTNAGWEARRAPQ